MRGRLLDPKGPRWMRALLPVAGATLSVCEMALGAIDPVFMALMITSFAAMFLSPWLLGRHKPRDVTIDLGPGYLSFTGAGLLNQRLRARDLTGATTARHGRGLSLALARKHREDVPMILELETDEDVRAVRSTLGIGHVGFGTVAWATRASASTKATPWLRILGFVSAVVTLLCCMYDPAGFEQYGALCAVVAGNCALALAVTVLMGDASGPAVRMRPDGLQLTGSPRPIVPYDTITSVERSPAGMALRLSGDELLEIPVSDPGRAGSGLSADECAHVVSHIVSARQRADGMVSPKPEASARIEILARENDAPGEWLARVDGAAAICGAATGYRGAGLDANDLWTTLEDPDADAHLRAAAARILLQIDKETAPARVKAAVAATRDESVVRRIRIVIEPDVSKAAAALRVLEDAEMPPIAANYLEDPDDDTPDTDKMRRY